MPLDSSNQLGVGKQGNNIVILASPMRPLPEDEALNMAAWIVALTGRETEFAALLEEIKNS
jgi:hypothetical protein